MHPVNFVEGDFHGEHSRCPHGCWLASACSICLSTKTRHLGRNRKISKLPREIVEPEIPVAEGDAEIDPVIDPETGDEILPLPDEDVEELENELEDQ